MTVPAFSLPAVPTGAPPSPMGTGAAAPSGQGGLFEGLLAGAIQAEQGGGSASDDQTGVEVINTDAANLTADAGATLMAFTPVAAPLAVAPSGPSDTIESEALDATGGGARNFGGSRLPAAPAPVVDDILDTLDLAAPDDIGDLAGVIAEAGERGALPAKVAAPGALAAPPPVTAATQATVQSAVVAPPPVAPPVIVVAAPAPGTANTTETTETAAAALTGPARPTSADSDNRRAPGAARAERRDGAGRTDAAGVSPFAPKSDLLAASLAAGTGPAGGEAEVGSDAAPDLAALDTAEAPEARQPSLIAETHVQAPPTTAAVIDAAAVRGSPETVAKMAADIVRKLDGQSTRFDLQLDPHGMGKVDVAIEIDRDGKLTAAMSFDSARSASDLRGRAGELRQALEQAGFDIAEGGLTFDLSDQGGGFSGREAGQQERAWNGRAFQRAQSGADDADLSLAATPSIPSRWTRSGVDIRI